MINTKNLGSKGSVGVKYKDNIYSELCLKLWFESDWYFCNITESGLFWKQLSRNKVPNNHFLKSVQKQSYADVPQKSVLKNFATVKHMCWSLFQINLKNRLQHRCFPVNIAEFLRTAFFKEKFQWWLHYWASADLLLLIKQTM